MSSEGESSLRLGLSMLAAGACGMAAWIGMSALAKPPDFAVRQAALAQRVAQLGQLAKLPSDAGAFGPRALCPAPDAASMESIRGAIQAASGGADGVKLTYVALQPTTGRSDGARLAPVALNLRAQGSYDAISAFVDRLAGLQPVVFVDRLDLQSAQTDVVLNLAGKVFCWTSA